MTQDKLSLSELPSALKAEGYVSPTYYAIYRHVIDGHLADLIERQNSRWVTTRGRVPAIANALGLSKQETAAA